MYWFVISRQEIRIRKHHFQGETQWNNLAICRRVFELVEWGEELVIRVGNGLEVEVVWSGNLLVDFHSFGVSNYPPNWSVELYLWILGDFQLWELNDSDFFLRIVRKTELSLIYLMNLMYPM